MGLAVLVVAFVGGVLTALSPCVLPVLPVILAGSAGGGRRSPYAIVTGLVLSFTLFTLTAGALLRLLGLPMDLVEWLGLVMLGVLAVALLVPAVGELLERPFARLSVVTAPAGQAAATRGPGRGGGVVGGVVLGVALGAVFAPCAGPVLSTVTVAAARERYGAELVFLALAYAVGVAVPLLALALVANRTSHLVRALRTHMVTVRRVAGVVIGLTALVMAFNWTGGLKNLDPWSSTAEQHVASSLGVNGELQRLKGEKTNTFARPVPAGSLPDLGRAPDFTGITAWINTPGDRPLTMAGLRGKVVLVDFWTYSCINCQRSLPHVEAWYRAYQRDGLVVVGVHSPEFPFEHVVSNVRAAVARLGVRYPVAVDDDLATWSAYNNEYWPAEYLIDQDGNVRYTSFGEGDYGTTERNIRLLLQARPAADGRPVVLPPPTEVADRTPTQPTTPESYLGYARLDNAQGTPVRDDRAARYRLVTPAPDQLSFGGTWTVHQWAATAGPDARLALSFEAQDVYLVLGGTGTVGVSIDGVHRATVAVHGIPDLYTLATFPGTRTGLLTLTFSPGVQAYDFTFG